MVAGETMKVRGAGQLLSYAEATDIARRVRADGLAKSVLLDLEPVSRTTTAALARLVLLRRRMLAVGGDLHVLPPHGRARSVYEVCHFEPLLPQA